jgi:hypothetical protein
MTSVIPNIHSHSVMLSLLSIFHATPHSTLFPHADLHSTPFSTPSCSTIMTMQVPLFKVNQKGLQEILKQ